MQEQFQQYRATLQDDRRRLLERFQIVDAARKVVGVGSVGTRAFIALLQGPGEDDVLFLQVKEAGRSVLETHLPDSAYRNAGERVVQGQRMMQAVSDIFLGWTTGAQTGPALLLAATAGHEGSAEIETMAADSVDVLRRPLRLDPRPGARPVRATRRDRRIPRPEPGFDDAITDFSHRYADQNEQDYQAFTTAISTGRLPAVEGV